MEEAGPLSFVRLFNPETVDNLDQEQKEASARLFVIVCQSLIAKHQRVTRAEDELFEEGIITTFEIPLIVRLDSVSAVYALVYGQKKAGGVLNLSICVEAYNEEQATAKGYMYGIDAEGFSRTTNTGADYAQGFEPFSIIDHLEEIRTLEAMAKSDNHEAQEEAREHHTRLDESGTIRLYEAEFGYDGQTPDEDEIYKLADLLLGAAPRIQA